MFCLPKITLKILGLPDLSPDAGSLSQMAALGTKSTNNSEDELTCSIVISECACPDLGGDLTVLNFAAEFPMWFFFLEAVSFFFFCWGVIPWKGAVFSLQLGKHGFLLALPTHLVPFWCCSRMVRTVTVQMLLERRRDFLTRHQNGWQAGFFRPDVGIAFLRWNETRLQFRNFKSMFEGQFLHQLGCIVNSGINYQAELVSLHPGKLTWNPKMKVWKMILLFNCVIFLL